MHKLYEAQHHADAHMLAALLQSRGIAAEVRGEALFTTVRGASAIPGMCPAVWIPDPRQLESAQELLRQYLSGPVVSTAEGPWECPSCHERHEPQFGACWKCSTARPQDPEAGPAQ